MVKRWLILLVSCLLAWLWLSNQTRAWFDAVAHWDNLYIAAANEYDATPEYHDDPYSCTVAGAGIAGANGSYTYTGLDPVYSKPYYSNGTYFLKQALVPAYGIVLWSIKGIVDDQFYYCSTTNPVENYPWLSSAWAVTGSGIPSAPTSLTQAGGPYVDAPDGGTVSLPITFRVALRPISPATITTCKIQYKKVSDGLWYDLTPTYTSAKTVIDFLATQTAFGHDTATTSEYAKGAAMRFRLYATDGITENADPSAGTDTTEDGTNGWEDEWVLGLTAHASNEKPPRPTSDN